MSGLAFAGSAAGLVAVSVALRLVSGATAFHAYPGLSESVSGLGFVLCGVLLACAVAPFCDRRGVGR